MAGSRSDRQGRRAAPPPPVIDLKAEDVGDAKPDGPAATPTLDTSREAPAEETPQAAETPDTVMTADVEAAEEKPWAAEEPAADTSAPIDDRAVPRSWAPVVGYGVAALVLVALGSWLYYAAGDRLFGGARDEQIASLASRLDQAATAAQMQTDRLAALDNELRDVRGAQAQLAAAVEEIRKREEESTAAARQSIEAGDGRISEVERKLADSQAATNALRSVIAEAGNNGASALATGELRTSFEALAARLTETEKRLGAATAELESLRQAANEAALGREKVAGDAVALGQAVTALAAKVRQGAPYASEIDALATIRPALPGLDVLRLHAETGVKTFPALADALSRLPPPTSAPSQSAQSDHGFWSALRSRFTGLVKIRRLDEADWAAVARDARGAIGNGDLPAAIAIVEAASANPPPAAGEWLADARARRDAEAALSQVETASLAQLGGKS